MTETAHPSLDAAQSTFKSLWDAALETALNALFAEAPWLNIPVLRDIVRGVARLAASSLFSGLKLVIDMAAIPIINSHLKSVFDEKSAESRFILIKYGKDSPEFQASNEGAHDAFADFFRNNATLPR